MYSDSYNRKKHRIEQIKTNMAFKINSNEFEDIKI